jgi:hypothetical protein
MSELFGRKCSLVIGNDSGDGLELSELHVKFVVNRADVQSPAHADIRVYNLSRDTMQRLEQEFTHVFLQAGYEGNYGLIFSGKVRQFRKGRENATDTYLDILAQDGDDGYNFAVLNTSLPANWDQAEMHAEILKAFEPYGVTTGYVPEFGGPALPRGRVLYGMARDHLRTLAGGSGSSWHISDGLLNMVPLASTLPGDVEVLTSATGMVGMPQQTINGVTVKSLLNPRIKHGGQIKIDNASVQQQAFNISYQPGLANANFAQDGDGPVTNTGLDADGNYKVYSITMTGDTRGLEWYSDLICVGLDATSPLAGPYINATASGTGY